MSEYQKVIRGRESLRKLPELSGKLGISKPLIVGMEPLISTLIKKNPWLVTAPVFTGFHSNPDLRTVKKGPVCMSGKTATD